MANRKISDLTALTAPVTSDLLQIVDISEAAAADKNKKITIEKLFQGIPGNVGIGTSSPNEKLEVAGGIRASGVLLTGSANSIAIDYSTNARIVSYGANTSTQGGFVFLGANSNASTSLERLGIDSSGRLLVGTSTSSMSGGTVQQNGNLGIIANNATNVSNNGTLDIVINSDGSCYSGFLIVENTLVASAATRTQATYSVLGRGTSATATSIATLNGSTAAASFTLTYPSNGTIRITNTCGGDTNINLVWFGPRGY